ncbi:hypothetical protein [Streptomyces sp. NPDC093589]|uniref:hypothetical protein n=1 Tax=Streptomyces sp. NPDC093589 TaxID=3366043 RepID=UPI0038173D25
MPISPSLQAATSAPPMTAPASLSPQVGDLAAGALRAGLRAPAPPTHLGGGLGGPGRFPASALPATAYPAVWIPERVAATAPGATSCRPGRHLAVRCASLRALMAVARGRCLRSVPVRRA